MQTVIVILLVAAAAAWCLWKAFRWWQGRGRCGCDHCPSSRDQPKG
jgi:hypothetical protein